MIILPMLCSIVLIACSSSEPSVGKIVYIKSNPTYSMPAPVRLKEFESKFGTEKVNKFSSLDEIYIATRLIDQKERRKGGIIIATFKIEKDTVAVDIQPLSSIDKMFEEPIIAPFYHKKEPYSKGNYYQRILDIGNNLTEDNVVLLAEGSFTIQ